MDELLKRQIYLYQQKLFNIETEDHVENVSTMTVYIAGFFGFSEEELYFIKTMAVFHDIGKIKIPIEILEKKDRLTDAEWRIIKKHPMYGRDILRDFGFKNEELSLITQHHEKCDGTGYPEGLESHEISLEAKILGAVDVMDALLSDRAYKDGWEPERVREFFEKNDEGFCPIVVEKILEEFDNLINIRK